MNLRLIPFAAVLLLTSAARAGEFNSVLKIGDDAPAWVDLPGIDEKKHSLADLKGKAVVVVVFTCNSCPVAELYEDRIMALHPASRFGDLPYHWGSRATYLRRLYYLVPYSLATAHADILAPWPLGLSQK